MGMITRGLGTGNIVTRDLGPWPVGLLWRAAHTATVFIRRVWDATVVR